jgi:hypothetical protein
MRTLLVLAILAALAATVGWRRAERRATAAACDALAAKGRELAAEHRAAEAAATTGAVDACVGHHRDREADWARTFRRIEELERENRRLTAELERRQEVDL